jgi:hemerythrin
MANELEWNEAYRLGIEGIDAQHAHLFEIVGRIAALDAATSTKEELRDILAELSDYMRRHFADEEVYMKRIGFPEYEAHRTLHREIITFFNGAVSHSPTIAMIQTKLKFIIKKALVDHIVGEDMKIQRYAATLKSDFTDDCVIELA